MISILFSFSDWYFPIISDFLDLRNFPYPRSNLMLRNNIPLKFLHFRLAIFGPKLDSGTIFADSFHTQQSVITPFADCITDYNGEQNRLWKPLDLVCLLHKYTENDVVRKSRWGFVADDCVVRRNLRHSLSST